MNRTLACCIVAVTATVTVGCAAPQSQPSSAGPSWSATGAEIVDQLGRVRTIPTVPRVGGYDRDCGTGHACSFGPAWTDDTSAPGGRNGCRTRDDVLAAQLRDVEVKPGSRCVVVAGVLDDPYTGKTIRFEKAHASDVHIDHKVPLSRVFVLAAHAWTQEQRVAFANDTATELIAVDGHANMAKGDAGLEWLPNRAYHCRYVHDYLAVSIKYTVPITAGDRAVAERVAAAC